MAFCKNVRKIIESLFRENVQPEEDAGAAPGGNDWLLEDGTSWLLEDGTNWLLE